MTSDTIQADRITRARIRLLLDQPWFGQLSLNLKVVEDAAIPTMATDGTRLVYNPTWTATQSDDVLIGTIAHGAMHCGLRHMYRCHGRDMARWNRATDLAINPLLTASNLILLDGALDDAQYHGLAAETIYAKLSHDDEQKSSDDAQNAQGDAADTSDDLSDDSMNDDAPGDAQTSGGPSDLLPAPDPSTETTGVEQGEDAPLTEVDWQIMAEQAEMAAKKRGLMPADATRAIDESLEARVDWRAALREFVEQTLPSDYSWTQPNRRYIAQGLYLPGIVKENTARLCVALDTSGSINQKLLAQFAAELSVIMSDLRPSAIDVVSCDARVQNVQTFTPDDGEITPEPIGGGGTAFQPVFDWAEEQDEQPAAIVYLTDLQGDQPREPSVPVLWVVPDWITDNGPFGTTIRIAS